MQIYSISYDKIGEEIESDLDKYSGPSNVTNLSVKLAFGSFNLYILVFLVYMQN